MATVAETKLLTAEEFMAADLGEGNFELVRGKVVFIPPGTPEHGLHCGNVCFALESYGRKTSYGYAISNSCPVLTERGPDTVRGIDVCFYSHARWPRSQLGKGLPPVPPDVAVEVFSSGNRPGEMIKRVSEYQEIGTLMIWVVYPARRSVVIHRPDDEPPLVLGEDAVLENLPELPGFRCPVSDFFV
jgi:Uma2 family endonuclease